jgi:uncharacterized membrane protein YobD (UPF0266 family)
MLTGAIFTVVVGYFQNTVDQTAMSTMILLATLGSAAFYILARSARKAA